MCWSVVFDQVLKDKNYYDKVLELLKYCSINVLRIDGFYEDINKYIHALLNEPGIKLKTIRCYTYSSFSEVYLISYFDLLDKNPQINLIVEQRMSKFVDSELSPETVRRLNNFKANKCLTIVTIN